MIRWYYYIAKWTVYWYFKLVTRLKVEGLENIPAEGPVLLVANHLNNADPPLVSVTLKRNAIFMAKEQLFRNRCIGYLVCGLGAFPVHRGQMDRQAIRDAENVLERNLILVMFPEAARSKDGKLHEAHPGSALIASRHDVPIVPVAITGTEKLTDRWFIFRRYPVSLSYGKPFHLPGKDSGKRKKDLEASTRFIMEHIAEMLPGQYRGFYSSGELKNEAES